MSYHLIVGFGKWSKKNLKYLKRKKKLSKTIIKTRHNYIYPNRKIIDKCDLKKILNKIYSVHICTPVDSHFEYLKKFKSFKKVIVEKPIVKKKIQLLSLKKIYKNKSLIVNYTDTFNPLIGKIKNYTKKNNINKIVLNYSKRKIYYKKKYDFAEDWLDHPLSLILLFFKKFNKLEIQKNLIHKKNNLYNQTIILKYKYSKFEIFINLNTTKKTQRNMQIFFDKNNFNFNFNQNSLYKNRSKIFKSNLNSFDVFYKFLNADIGKSLQNYKFHEKIFYEKQKIIKILKQ